MRKFKQEKLWRDKAPEIMEAEHGSKIHLKDMSDEDFDVALRDKIVEEALEVNSASSRGELLSELGDLQDVIEALVRLYNFSPIEIKEKRQEKLERLGGFEKRKFVIVAEHPPGSFGEKYCINNPEKYPELP